MATRITKEEKLKLIDDYRQGGCIRQNGATSMVYRNQHWQIGGKIVNVNPSRPNFVWRIYYISIICEKSFIGKVIIFNTKKTAESC